MIAELSLQLPLPLILTQRLHFAFYTLKHTLLLVLQGHMGADG